MAATLSSIETTSLPNGERMLRAVVTLSNVYLTNGETTDLSAYFSGSPVVLATSTTTAYQLHHNGGTAAAGKIVAAVAQNANAASGLSIAEAANAADLSSVTGKIIAFGVAV